ncbi:caspase-8-like [Branchiostoma floridae]|uniref:Caspase-8-like n=1 Tax=Branchiostoma floridae TaxID=7739 RepID=A0A9J7ME68_BRAFL|nr:caspase-8-like [Branchiostoma floridae]
MSNPCTVQSSTVCLPCPRGHYAEQYNHLSECHRCHQCNVMNNGHEHETLLCTAVQNRQCECDNGYFKPTMSPICLHHTKCPRGQGVIEKGTHQTDTRCMLCRSGTFSDEISSTAECRTHTDCAARGECFVFRGHHKRDNVCAPCSPTIKNSTSKNTVGQHYTAKQTSESHVFSIILALFVMAFSVVLFILMRVLVSYKMKRGQEIHHIISATNVIDLRKEQHGNDLAIDDNNESNEIPVSKEQFQLYNKRMMATLQRKTDAERIAIDLNEMLEKDNIDLKKKVVSEKKEVARLKEENIHLKNQAGSDKMEVARLKDQIVSLTTETNNTYRMSHKPRGTAVIINSIHFEDMATRDGAEGDTGRLQEAFESLGFTVMTFIDLDHSKMVATMKDQGNADHSNYDCFACCIMSHGTTGKVFSSDDVGIDICEIMKPFHANKCPSLKGKPKLFFIQACQGEKIQGKESTEGDLDATPGDDVPLNFICNEADFFLGLSTVPGHISKRGQDGAPYVFHLAKLLKDFGPTHDLSAIMAMVCDKMNDINDDTFGWISSYHSTLRKKVFFSTN